MIKVVIADDEAHICRLIQALMDWEGLGMELSGFAANGIEALELIKKENPDILITDIKMPGCGGVELIEQVRKICSNIQIVVISGYANFEYAQSAIKLGVRDYLLKPINKTELCDTMRKLKANIEEERNRVKLQENNQENQKKDEKKLRQLLVERLLNGQASSISAEVLEGQYHFPIKTGYFLGFCLRCDIDKKDNFYEIFDIYKEQIIKVFDTGLGKCCFDWTYYQYNFYIYGILNCTEGNKSIVKKTMYDCLNQINSQKHLFGNVDFTLGIGSFEKNIECLPESLQNAEIAVKERLVKGNGKVIEYEAKNRVLYEKKLLDQYSREIAHVLEVLNPDELEAANMRLYNEVMDTKGLQGVEIYELVIEAGNMFIVRLNLQDKSELLKHFTDECDLCANALNLFETMNEFEKNLFKEYMDRYEQDSTRPIRLAKQYIQNHYMEQISLEEVSDYVGLSPAYFSVIFKKEADIGFAKYLMNVRVEQAKVLLRETNLSVSDICKKVGYKDLKYFTQTFSKLTGVKPAVFRKLYG
ncbi:MAG: response regulator [Coprococcus sp.]